ncbi:MAG: Transcriptional regulatory protein ZraR [Pseudomonadota bacterium]
MSPLSGLDLLVVEDDTDLRRTLIAVIESCGGRAAAAAGGHEAWGLLVGHHFDAVITDVRMADGDGLELLRRVRGRDGDRPPVLLISGHADLQPDEARSRGAAGLLAKPFGMDALLSAIDAALARE